MQRLTRSPGRVLLIDGDIVAYKYASAHQETVKWGDDDEGQESVFLDEQQAQDDAVRFVDELVLKLKAKGAIVCLSDRLNFRYRVLPTYKHNRQDKARPELLKPVKAALAEAYDSVTKDQLEGDDAMGILATQEPKKYLICTIDKDMQQIPGVQYNWKKELLFSMNLTEANRFFYTQVLTGDSTDGYSGCPGIGPKKADIILGDLTSEVELWQAILEVYKLKGLSEEDALVQARVARILRDGEYAKDGPVLWTPKTKE